MIFHPGIMALLLGSILTCSMLCYSAYAGARIVMFWDIMSGSELQLELERKTYLISTIIGYALGFQLLSLFLFVYTADHLSSLFVGAMCAAGSLKASSYGYPTIILKLFNFLLAGLWLVINYVDTRAHDYPLIEIKYGLLLLMAPFLTAETILQGGYLLGLRPNIITSCCGTLFSEGANTLVAGLAAFPRAPAQVVFSLVSAATLGSGLYFRFQGRGAYLFSVLSLLMLPVSIISLISFICMYFYELPTHHCPFCILHEEYGYVGYGIYLALLVGAVAGTGVGAVEPFRGLQSLAEVAPRIQRRLATISVIAYSVFVIIVGYGILSSHLTMAAY
jgi:hypothetical protein